MRVHASWTIAVVLALPGPALGQAVKPADLVGTWVQFADAGEGALSASFWKLESNGTYAYEYKIRKNTGEWGVPEKGNEGSWSLAGDTLSGGAPPRLITLKNRQLFLFRVDSDRRGEVCAEQRWERFDSLTPIAAPPPPQITIRPADLVGTWTGTFKHHYWGTITDSLFIGADYTLRSVHVGPFDDAHERGTWTLQPGDVLVGIPLKGPYQPATTLGNTSTATVYLRNGNTELVRCDMYYAPLKRVAP